MLHTCLQLFICVQRRGSGGAGGAVPGKAKEERLWGTCYHTLRDGNRVKPSEWIRRTDRTESRVRGSTHVIRDTRYSLDSITECEMLREMRDTASKENVRCSKGTGV